MRRVLLIVTMLLLLTTTSALAEDREWRAEAGKQGTAGTHLCIGYAEAGGHSYRNTNIIDDEILRNCDRYARADVVQGFRVLYGIDLDPASVKVTVSKP